MRVGAACDRTLSYRTLSYRTLSYRIQRSASCTSSPMLPKLLFNLNPTTYRLFDRARRKLRPLYESDMQKHWRERQKAEYLLLSLTNCGRTWLRVILGRALQLHYGIQEINLHDLYRFSEVNPNLPRIKPMHEKYRQFGYGYTHQKVILLVRDPRDAIVSRYHQHKEELGFERLDAYVKDGPDLTAYIQFYNDWQTHRSSAADFLLVRYEDMKADTYREVKRVVDFLGLPITPDEIHQAIEYASFKNMRKMEIEGSAEVRTDVLSARDVNQPNSFKVRKGAIGGYRNELSAKAIAQIDQAIKTRLSPAYGYGQPAQLAQEVPK